MKLKHYFFTTILLLYFIFTAQASHFAGASLTYSNIGGNNYLITFSFYRDCSGATAPTNAVINLSCSSNPSYNYNTTLSLVSGSGQEITPSS